MCKDFSTGHDCLGQDGLFEACGVTPLDDTSSMTYDQCTNSPSRLPSSKRPHCHLGLWLFKRLDDRIWMVALAETGRASSRTGTPKSIREMISKRWRITFYTVAKDRLCEARDASPNGWSGGDSRRVSWPPCSTATGLAVCLKQMPTVVRSGCCPLPHGWRSSGPTITATVWSCSLELQTGCSLEGLRVVQRWTTLH